MGVDVYEVPGQARIDYSNISEGYVLVSYLGSDTSKKLKISVLTPNKKSYNFYNLSHDGSYTIIPLTEGNGSYQVTVSKNTTGSIYSRLASKTFDVTLKDEFAPFRHSNQYVNYSKYGKVAEKARQLTANSTSELQSLQLIYNFVVNYLTYDYTKAAAATAPGAVTSDFIPDVEHTYATKKGICSDYAALTAAMLRSIGIRAKVEIGYYSSSRVSNHAWISVYIDGMGWLNGVIEFKDGTWNMLDPTFASTSARREEYITTKSRYTTVNIL